MRDFVISTETTADLPDSYIEEHHILLHRLYYSVDDNVYGVENTLPYHDFYEKMRKGAMTSTMASNPDLIEKSYKKILEEGKDILHISFSSALSCSYNNASVTAREMLESNPDAKIIVLDSLCASLGQGLLVHTAVTMKEEGKSIDEIAEWVEAHKLNLCHQFTVDDLNYLHRGGRIKKSVAVLGTLINVKPILHVDNEGRLVPLINVRGRKKSLIALVDNMEKTMGNFKNDTIFISHGDAPEDAEFVKNLIIERFGSKNFLIDFVSPTIGSHSGPGTIALFYYGETR